MVAKTFEEALPDGVNFGVTGRADSFMSGPYTLFNYQFKETTDSLIGRMKEADDLACDQAFADRFVDAISGRMTPHQLSLLVKGFGAELIKWSKEVGSDDAMELSFSTFEDLLQKSTQR